MARPRHPSGGLRLAGMAPLGSGAMTRVVLASASQARLRVLQAAGLRPEVIPSQVNEPRAITRSRPRDLTLALAEAKAAAVARAADRRPGHRLRLGSGDGRPAELAGLALGKPATAAEARERWRLMAGQTASCSPATTCWTWPPGGRPARPGRP